MKKVFSIAFIALTISVFAQQNINRVFEKLNKQTDIIIEGKIIHSKGVWDEKNKTIFTVHTVKASKIFKGNYADSITYFRTIGGTANDITLTVHDMPTLSKNGTYILFGKRVNENDFMPLLSEDGFIQLFADGVNPPAIIGETHVSNIEKEIYRPLEKHLQTSMKIVSDNDIEIKNTQMFSTYTVPLKEGIEYTLDNLKLLGSGLDSIEFDIFARTLDYGYKYFSSGDIFFKYDTAIFGSFLATKGDIEVLKEAISYSSDYLISVADEYADIVKLTVERVPNPTSLYAISNLANKLLKVKVNLPNNLALNAVQFDEQQMQTKSEYYKILDQQDKKFDTVVTRVGLYGTSRGSGDLPLELRFQDAQVTTDINGNKNLEFNVYARSPQEVSELGQIAFEVKYNPAVFGSTANQFDTYPIGGFRNKYATSVALGTQPNARIFGINVINPPTTATLNTTSFDSLMHIIMPIGSCNAKAGIFADSTTMKVGTYWITPGYGNYLPVLLNDSINPVLCPDSLPVLYSVSPKTVRAGINDTLTFIGKNIMPDTANGAPFIYFRNADNPNFEIEVPIADKLFMSDSIVKIVVPSQVTGTEFNRGTAGSCKPKIALTTNLSAALVSPDSIVVDYALINLRQSSVGAKAYRVNLFNQNGNGGHTIRFNSTFNTNTKAVKCFGRALNDWRCATGINFSTSTPTSISTHSIDSINVVAFVNPSVLVNPAYLAATYTSNLSRNKICIGSNSEDSLYQNFDFDILFNDAVDWHFDTTGTLPCPSGKFDFYSVALHEIGHAHQIDHVLDETKSMHYNIGQTTQRKLAHADIAAGINVVSYSINPDGTPCLPPMIQFFPTNCVSSVENFNTDSKLSLFPNPNNGSFSVSINSENEAVSKFYITNTVGQKLVEEQLLFTAGINSYQFQLSNLNSGIYFISFTVNQKAMTQKIVIEQ